MYILFSKNLNRYYIGSTGNIYQRIQKHLQSRVGFTSKAKDWKLYYSEKYNSRTEALNREKQIKKWKSRRMIENLLEDENNI